MVKIRKQEQQAVEFDVHRYQQGGRIAYSLIMDLGTVDSIVPPFVNRHRIDKANRRFNPTHAQRIAEYIYEIEDWVLGAILLGIDPAYVEFVPYLEDDGQESESLGFIRIPLDGGTSSISILDGQHRRMGIRTARERLRQEIHAQKELSSNSSKNGDLQRLQVKLDQLSHMAIPAMLYEEADTKELRQMWADLAKTRPIDATTKTRFDDRDPFNRAAVHLVELGRSTLLSGRVEMERTTAGRTSNHLLAVNQLAKCLKVLKYGYGGRASQDRIREAERNYEDLIDIGITWADEFLPAARHEYEELMSIETEEDFVSEHRSEYVTYRASIMQMLAGCLYAWNESCNLPWQDLASWLRHANFDLKSDTCIFLETGMQAAGDNTLIARKQYIERTIDTIVNQAQLQTA